MRKLAVWIAVALTPLMAPAGRTFDTWTSYGGGADSSQYSSLNQINKTNVNQLEMVWSFPSGGNPTFNPIVVDGVIYVSAMGGIMALDAATGKELWARQGGAGTRGINYWESADRSDRRLISTAGGLSAIDARTGEPIASFGQNGRVNAGAGLSPDDRGTANPRGNPGRIAKDVIVVPLPAGGASYDSTPGDIHGYDVRTGRLLWVFHTIPQPGEFGYDTWPKDAWKTVGGVHNWSEMTVDEERGIAYIPLGTARYDFYGGNRKGQNLFGNSILALDVKTGKRLWHFQTIHHDLWDYDLPIAPKLLTVQNAGRSVDVVAQATKHGFLFVFDRVTGAPLWPIEERAVPKSDVPGEESWPTQPFPTKPPPFARQSFTEKDINPFIPETEQAAIRERMKTYRNEGLFTPPSIRGSVEMPGHNGGANWGRAAVDPTKGFLYVVSSEQPTLMALNAPGAGGARGGAAPAGGAAGRGGTRGGARGGTAPAAPRGAAPAQGAGRGGNNFQAGQARGPVPAAGAANTAAAPTEDFVRYNSTPNFMNSSSTGLSLIGPPWSQLTAYDLNSGTILWQVPNGEVTALARQGKTGLGAVAPRGGPVVTAGGLIFVGTSSDRKFRAYDQDTGKVLWQTDLPAASDGVPAVYQVQGRQYVVIPVSGNGYLTQPRIATNPPIPAAGPGEYRVFALPKR